MTRRYLLAARPIHLGLGRPMRREIREQADGQPSQFVIEVTDADAEPVRKALERAYANGQEDRWIPVRESTER